MWTIDTSVWVSASEPTQAHHVARLRSVTRAERAVRVVRRLPTITCVVLDDILAERARQLAATHRLRGADAAYATVAQAWTTTLLSLDGEHLARLPPVVSVLTPGEALRQLQS